MKTAHWKILTIALWPGAGFTKAIDEGAMYWDQGRAFDVTIQEFPQSAPRRI